MYLNDRLGCRTHQAELGNKAMNSEDTQAVFQRTVNVLSISPHEEDHRHVRDILKHSNWQQHTAHTEKEACDFLRENVAPVAICESELPDGTWQDVLAQFGRMECPPLLIVTSRTADDRLWSEVLNLGGYNVLAKPLNAKEVFHVAGTAWIAWKRQWEGQSLARSA
jgi:DNA-binding NtrC family response regulator